MRQQNVLVIMSDEHTRSMMGAYGNPLVKTPALDQLANSGIRFENAYTPSPICISARASFATGTQVFEHRCWSSAEPYYGQHQSWMHRLRARGNEVVSIGKLHYRSGRDDCGFSDRLLPMFLANDGAGWPLALLRRPLASFPEAAELASTVGPGETSYTQYDRDITATAVQWLQTRVLQKSDKAWVLFVSFICPHYPLSAPEEFYNQYRDVELPHPYDFDPEKQVKHPVLDQMRKFWNYNDYFSEESQIEGLRNYYGLCSFMDDNIRQILDALEQSGSGDNTQIIYTSDHGDMTGNHGIWGKCYMYEDSVGIPMTLTGPGIESGVNKTPVSLTDMAATIENFVYGKSSDVSHAWQSRPIQHFIDDPEPERPVLSEYHDGGSPTGIFMLRKGPWKYVYFAEYDPALLFNLEQDPHELHNLGSELEYQSIRSDMRETLNSILDPEQVNRNAFSDQARMIDNLGGLKAIQKIAGFNHTPLD